MRVKLILFAAACFAVPVYIAVIVLLVLAQSGTVGLTLATVLLPLMSVVAAGFAAYAAWLSAQAIRASNKLMVQISSVEPALKLIVLFRDVIDFVMNDAPHFTPLSEMDRILSNSSDSPLQITRDRLLQRVRVETAELYRFGLSKEYITNIEILTIDLLDFLDYDHFPDWVSSVIEKMDIPIQEEGEVISLFDYIKTELEILIGELQPFAKVSA